MHLGSLGIWLGKKIPPIIHSLDRKWLVYNRLMRLVTHVLSRQYLNSIQPVLVCLTLISFLFSSFVIPHFEIASNSFVSTIQQETNFIHSDALLLKHDARDVKYFPLDVTFSDHITWFKPTLKNQTLFNPLFLEPNIQYPHRIHACGSLSPPILASV